MEKKTRKRSKGFTLVEILTAVAIIGILASMAIPAFNKYIRRSKTSEALMNLRKMYDGSVSYFAYDFSSRVGSAIPKQFPDTVALTPGTRFCRDDNISGKWNPNDAYWAQPTWRALNFGISDPHYFSYEYVSSGVDSESLFTARANGDLNCNQTFSTFERIGKIEGRQVSGGAGVFSAKELE